MAERLIDDKIKEVAWRIKSVREDLGYSASQMAEKTGVSTEEYLNLEAGASDFKADGEVFVVTTEPDDVYAIQEDLKNAGYEILSAEKTKQASTSVTLENEDDIKFMNLLIEKLEEDDDVMDVYHNWENCDD